MRRAALELPGRGCGGVRADAVPKAPAGQQQQQQQQQQGIIPRRQNQCPIWFQVAGCHRPPPAAAAVPSAGTTIAHGLHVRRHRIGPASAPHRYPPLRPGPVRSSLPRIRAVPELRPRRRLRRPRHIEFQNILPALRHVQRAGGDRISRHRLPEGGAAEAESAGADGNHREGCGRGSGTRCPRGQEGQADD